MPSIKAQITNRISETFRTVFIDTLSIGLDRKSSSERINRLKKDYPGIPLDVLADRKIKTQSRITTVEGSVSGAAISGIEASYAVAVTAAATGSGGGGGPVVAGPALVPTLAAVGAVVTTETTATTRAQMKLIVDLAEIYNCPYDTKNDEDAWFIFKSALDITTFDITLRSVQTAMNLEGRRLFIKLLQYKLIRRRFQKFVARTAGPRIANLLAQKYLARIVTPIINIGLGGYANNRFTKRIGKIAKKKAKIRSTIYKEMNENLKMSSDERVLFLSIMIQLANLSDYFSSNFMGMYSITAKHIKLTTKDDKEIEKLGELKSAPFLKYLEKKCNSIKDKDVRKFIFNSSIITAAVVNLDRTPSKKTIEFVENIAFWLKLPFKKNMISSQKRRLNK